MTHTDTTNKNAHVLLIGLTLQPSLISSDRRTFYRAMHKELAQHDLLMSHSKHLCAVLIAPWQSPTTSRHTVMNWLVDQAIVQHIAIHDPTRLARLLKPDYDVYSGDDKLDPAGAFVARMLISNLILGGLVQGLNRSHATSQRS